MATTFSSYEPIIINSGRQTQLTIRTSNLLDYQLVSAFKDCLENSGVNELLLLQHLECLSKGELKLNKDARTISR